MAKPKLTHKERGFVKDYVATRNGTQSILNNYDVHGKDPAKTASVMAVENLAKPRIQKTIAEMIPDELLTEKHLALLNKIDPEGEIDVQAVSKGLDMGYKIKGTYAPEKTQNINVNIDTQDPKARELALKYEEELKNKCS